MEEIEFIKIWDSALRDSTSKLRRCLVDNCNKTAIKSHALQKNGILKQISEKDHLYQFTNVPVFQRANRGNFELRQIGINDVFTFPGFCNEHDSIIFKPIEQNKFEIQTNESINLFSYRALCQEIRRKEIALDFAVKMIESFNSDIILFMSNFKTGLSNGLKNLYYFKRELEDNLKNDNDRFIHRICEIPRTEICISAPLNITDKTNPLSHTHDQNGKVLNNPFVTSFVNLFPYKGKSYVMVTLSKDFPCYWTEKMFIQFQSCKHPNHLKLISDLITTRVEFWCISPQLKNALSKKKISDMIKIWSNEVLNFDSNMETDFNLFD